MFKKFKKKTVIIIGLLTVLLLAAGTAVTLVAVKKGREEKAVLPPEYYFSRADGLSSVTEVVGEREFAELTDETAPEDGDENGGLSVEKYKYFSKEDAQKDVREYMEYLMKDKSFIDISGEEETEDAENRSFVYRLAGPADEEDSYLEITIEVTEDSYIVTAVREGQSWNSHVSRLWEEEKQKEAKPPEEPKSSRQIAEEKVRSMSQKDLKLPEPVEVYEFISNPGLILVDGKNYYRISAYRKQENGTLAYECAFLMDYESGNVSFKYDDVTEETEPLG